MMNIVLVTNTSIVTKIFKLICNKVDVDLILKNSIKDISSLDADIIVIDEEFVNDDFNTLKKSAKRVGAICSYKLPFDKSTDFVLDRPFLPSDVEKLLNKEFESIKDILRKEQEIISNYAKSLEDEEPVSSEDGIDESIIKITPKSIGGILDSNELNKISDILRYDDSIKEKIEIPKDDLLDINAIIDEALNDVQGYEFDLDKKGKNVNVYLNDYNISEIRPFLQKLDQSIIEKLSNSEDVNITLSLKVNNGK